MAEDSNQDHGRRGSIFMDDVALEHGEKKEEDLTFVTKWSSSTNHIWAIFSYGMGINIHRSLFWSNYFVFGNYLIVATILKLAISIPLTILELAMSQYSSKDILDVYYAFPAMKGLAYCTLLNLVLSIIEENIEVSFFLKYAITAVENDYKWKMCNNSWNSAYCFSPKRLEFSVKCEFVHTEKICKNISSSSTSSLTEFLYFNVQKNTINRSSYTDGFNFDMAICCFLSLLFVYLIIHRGTKYLEKILPIVLKLGIVGTVLFLWLFITNDSFVHGIKNIYKHVNPKKWLDLTKFIPGIAPMVFGSLSLAQGGYPVLGAQGDFRSNCYKRAILLNLLEVYISILTTIVIHGCKWFESKHHLMPEGNTLNSRKAWFSDILLQLSFMEPRTNAWAFVYMFSTYLIFLISYSVRFYVFVYYVLKILGKRKHSIDERLVIFICFAVVYALNLPFLQAGLGYATQIKICYIFTIGIVTTFICFGQSFSWVFIYGVQILINDIHFMLGFRPSMIIQVLIFLCPLLSFGVFCIQFHHSDSENFGYLPDSEYYFYLVLPLLITFVYMFWWVVKLRCNCKKAFRKSRLWNFADENMYISRLMFSAATMTKESIYRQVLHFNAKKKIEDEEEEDYFIV